MTLRVMSKIVPVITELLVLLVEVFVISRYNYLAQGDYSMSTKFQDSSFAFCQATKEVTNGIEVKSKFGLTVFKIKMSSFC